jgi:hypothetical protein
LAPWEGSVTQCSGMVTSTGGEVASGRGKGVDNMILTGPKIKKIHVVDSAVINGR